MTDGRWARVLCFATVAWLGACGDDRASLPPLEPPEGDNPPPVTRDCNVASDVCFLPYPSSVFATEQPTTPTGIQLALPDDAYPTFSVDSLNEMDGHSPSTALVTHFPEGVSPSGLPSPDDPVAAHADSLARDAPIYLLDIDATSPDYGRRVPYFAEAETSEEESGESLLVITPLRPLEPGGRYAVVVTRRVRAADGSRLPADPEVARLMADESPGGELDELWAYYGHLRHLLPGLGLTAGDVVQAWDFHTRSDEGLTRDLLAMRDDVLEWLATDPPAPTITSMEEDGGDVRYEFEYQNPIFRESETAPLNRDESGRPAMVREDTLRGIAIVPNDAPGTLTPLVFGHGFGMSADDLTGLIGTLDLSSGPYVLGLFDWDLHGERGSGADALIGLISPDTLESLAGVFQQSAIDELVFAANLSALNDTPELSGRVDTAGHLYGGVSMGGVYGTVATSIDDRMRASVLNVGGGGIINIVRFSSLFEGLGVHGIFEDLVSPEGASTTGLPSDLDAEVLMIVSQLAIDEGDAIHYGRHLVRDRFPGMAAEAPPIILQESIGDGIVPNFTTEALARTAALPLIEPGIVPVPGLETAEAPTFGMPRHGLTQFRVFAEGVPAHLALSHAAVQQQLLEFYASVLDDDPNNDGNIGYHCLTDDGGCDTF
ncbi:MAG: hypothetical protein ACOCXM_11745 [Myxococcota bacterium]